MGSQIGWDFILIDTSASMILNGKDVKQGIIDLFSEQKTEKSENKISIFTFNTQVTKNGDYYFPNVPDANTIDLRCYGKTSLIDAIGNVYDTILNNVGDDYSLISVNIITDGIENSSKQYSLEDLLERRIKISETYNLVVNFIGADETCLDDADKYQSNTSKNCNGDFLLAFRSLSSTLSSQRSPEYECTNQPSPPGSISLLGIKRIRSPLVTPHGSPSARRKPQVVNITKLPRNYSSHDVRGIESPPPLTRC